MPEENVQRMPCKKYYANARPAFTLVEVVVVIAIITILGALLVPAARGTLQAARSFKCQAAQRNVAFDFQVFGDDSLHGDRGDDAQLGRRFRIETFIESQYRIDEFWGWGSESVHEMPDLNGNDLMRCPEVTGQVLLMRNTPCTSGGVQPPQSVSFAFNMRLHVAEGRNAAGNPTARVGVPLTGAMLEQPDVPLLFDIDGQAAFERERLPLFSAPRLGSDVYSDDDWFPAMRHAGRMNAAFLDGSVRETRDPLQAQGWNWAYSPRP
jgi:prepilin-type processing-associated H-X9-DG protein/prepilin-type N-terminal cleavage/methylation domain-containing protein